MNTLRIAIAGWPKAGKTTMAAALEAQLGITARHTDDLIATHSWSDASAEVARWFDEPGPWIIEGVAVSRALRKWAEAHPGEPPPVDKVIYLRHPYEPLTKAQAAMGKGCDTVHAYLAGWSPGPFGEQRASGPDADPETNSE